MKDKELRNLQMAHAERMMERLTKPKQYAIDKLPDVLPASITREN